VGPEFRAAEFVQAHPEYAWMKDLLRDLRRNPWSRFARDMQ
jgi:hypothetical protein